MLSKEFFFFDETRETLFMNNNPTQYKFDYVFADYENPLLVSNTFNSIITQIIESEEANLLFVTFGEKSLQTKKFLFGSNSECLVTKDSFFDYVNATILKVMKQNRERCPFDTVSIEITKISQEKFIIDVRINI